VKAQPHHQEVVSLDDLLVMFLDLVLTGLPLDPTQYLELERHLTDDGVVFSATLHTTDEGLPQDESSSSTGDKVLCLDDLAGKII